MLSRPYVITTDDVVIGATSGTALSACTDPTNTPHKNLQDNIDIVDAKTTSISAIFNKEHLSDGSHSSLYFFSSSSYQTASYTYADVVSGGDNQFTCALTPTITGYNIGMKVFAHFPTGITKTTPTLNVDSRGDISIKRQGNSSLLVEDIPNNYHCLLEYDGTDFILYNPYGSTFSRALSAWDASKANDTVYRAVTDGFIMGWGNTGGFVGSAILVDIYTGITNPPTAHVASSSDVLESSAGHGEYAIAPVRKDDYYKITITGSGASVGGIFWISLGK